MIQQLRLAARRLKNRLAKSSMHRWVKGLSRALPADVDPTLTITGRRSFVDQITMGKNGLIERDVKFWISGDEGADPKLVLGDSVFIGQNSIIGVYRPVSIGSHALIGPFCYIISANHRYDRRDIPIGQQGFSGAPIVIEEDVWLGTHVVVLPGVTIGKGAIVAAGSIVNKSIPAYQIWAGTPARYIKDRPE